MAVSGRHVSPGTQRISQQPVRTFLRTGKSIAPARIRTPVHPAHSLVTTPTELFLGSGLQYLTVASLSLMFWLTLKSPRVMKRYSPIGRRNHGRLLKRLLDTWDRNGSTSGPTPWQIYDDDDDDDDDDVLECFTCFSWESNSCLANNIPYIQRNAKVHHHVY
jgi:hypothetical protein